MHVETILQAKGSLVYTLPETASLADAVSLLNTHNIGALVVTGAGDEVAGILSERDIVRQLGKEAAISMVQPVSAIMTRSTVTCRRDTEIAEIMDLMTEHRVRHIPVMEGRQLVGIISIGDVVKAKIEEIEHDAEALREYIAS